MIKTKNNFMILYKIILLAPFSVHPNILFPCEVFYPKSLKNLCGCSVKIFISNIFGKF